MRDSSRKVIVLLWIVIAVLVIGGGIGGYLLFNHANSLDQTNTELSGNNDSLKRQLDQAKAQLAATPTPSPVATPTPTPTPKAAVTPTPTPKR
jgi:flagellar basal body-associated protein FliL